MKVGDKAVISIGPASDFLGVTSYIEIVEVFKNSVAVKYDNDVPTSKLTLLSKDGWNKLTKE